MKTEKRYSIRIELLFFLRIFHEYVLQICRISHYLLYGIRIVYLITMHYFLLILVKYKNRILENTMIQPIYFHQLGSNLDAFFFCQKGILQHLIIQGIT